MSSYEEDTTYIIETLLKGLDKRRIGITMLALVYSIEEHWRAKKWSQSDRCCEQLKRLAEDPDMQEVSEIDMTYVKGIAQICWGAILLSQDSRDRQKRLENAISFFSKSQSLFQKANAPHSEAAAWLALGIAYQRQYELGIVHLKEHHWAETLKALQRSLTICQNLGDRLQVDVVDRLAEVQELFR